MTRCGVGPLGGILLAAALALTSLSPVTQAETRASLPDIEDEVMCTICGTLLEESQSPQADRERALIRKLIAQGEDKDQIKDALVAQYGTRVLATPSGHGFDLLAWIVPGLAIFLAAAGIAVALRRVRRSPPAAAVPPALSPEDRRRIDADLADFDS
jgi:cytochrome c-type biogenesis protein CcmH